MSGGGSGGGFRVSIPGSVRKTIQNIKEITGNHGDEEIYAMLKECGMDPNETTQKLLHQDTFHEVKRKRDRKKENVSNNREHGESRWRPGGQGRGGRGGRGNFPPHHVSHDAGRGRITGPVKENGLQQGEEKGFVSLPISHGTREKERSLATSRAPSNSSIQIAPGSSSATHVSNNQEEGGPELDTNVSNSSVNEDIHEQLDKSLTVSPVPTSTSTVCFSPSDPVVVPSNDSLVPSAVGTIKREVGAQRPSLEPNASVRVENKSSVGPKTGSSYPHGKTPSQSQSAGKVQLAEFSQPSSTSSQLVSSISRPSSNYSNRSSHSLGGGQRGGSTKEWKPKAVQGSGTAGPSDAPTTIEATTSSLSVSNLDSDDATSKLHKKLQELHLQQRQHVILPNHIHVPESERSKLSFGSFGTLFGVNTSAPIAPETEKSSTSMTETSQDIEENVEEDSSSNQNVLDTDEGDYSEEPQSPTHVPETQSCPDGDGDGDVDGDVDGNGSGVSSTLNARNYESKQDTGLPSGGHQHPMVQPIDQANYYAQFYHTGPDNDSRLSPGIAARYNGNVAQLPPSSQSLQEGGVFSADGPAPLISQATGIMPSSIAVTQQPLPMFRPPAGINISHYPPNYIPYGHYLPPFYVPPLAIHQYLGNGSFPQQPQAGGMFPAPPAIGTVGVKYSLPQYKQGTNTGNPAHMGMATGYYGPYGSSVGGYNINSGATTGNPTANENLGQSQFKENNVYLAGQQTEGLAMWVAAPGRDISTLPPSSFYNLPPQAQHVSFAPAQPGHSTFAGLYHPAHGVTTPTNVHPLLQQSQAMAGPVDMAGPGGGAYPKSQHGPINWPNNY